tara:strand:- start:964 stop:1197 length:234 start_codon:yes stop_codon:yes gene_type:complete
LTCERSGEVDRTEDNKVRPASMTLDKHAQIMLARLAIRTVVTHLTSSGVEHRQSISFYNAIKIYPTKGAKGKAGFVN